MSDGMPRERAEKRERESEEILRAKYLDYCSARVAEVLLELSPDEMYVLAHDAARGSSDPPPRTYEEIVRLSTDRVSSKLNLPPFEIWVEQYLEDPSHFDSELMGLWELEPGEPSGD